MRAVLLTFVAMHVAVRWWLAILPGLLVGCGGTRIDASGGHTPSEIDGGTAALPIAEQLCADWSTGVGGGPVGLVDCSTGEGLRLCGAPMIFRPTANGFAIGAMLSSGDPSQLGVRVRAVGDDTWGPMLPAEKSAYDLAQWSVQGLLPGRRYQYEVRPLGPSVNNAAPALYSGAAATQRPSGDSFVFALLSDSHIGPHASFRNQGIWCTLSSIGRAIGAARPDFVIHLGDMLDFHEFGFNEPVPLTAYTGGAYMNYRVLLGDTLGNTVHFPVIGNWEGEDGWFDPADVDRSRQQRFLYAPGPLPTTYPQSGSAAEDYYAFTWGDALFVVLNVMSYTPTPHLLSSVGGTADDWTLGTAQLDWLTTTLTTAKAKWRFVFIHHPVGGAAGTAENSAYGRGGGQAAEVGEQAKVHRLMLDTGAQIFFYGHDHVFTDMTVDGIHYTEPGSAGAPWMFSQAETGYSQSWLESGWAKVAVSPDTVQVDFISQTGNVLYQYRLP
jgi:hypothetical protein